MFAGKLKAGVVLAATAVVVLGAGITDAYAQKKMTRLGNPGTRFTAPIGSVAALKKTFAVKKTQASVTTVLDKAGMAALAPQVLSALTEGAVTETRIEVGTPIRWMATRRGGKPDIVLDAVWAGKAPFEGFAFTIEDGVKIYSFIVPKACGNVALLSVSEHPLPECVHVAATRRCEANEVSFTASGTAITNHQVTKVSILRDGTKVGEMLPAGFSKATSVHAGRYTFMATDKFGREYGTCERDIVVEGCVAPVAPPPPPPPAPTSCGALLTAVPTRGGWNLSVDASESGRGASPAAKAVMTLVGPAGTPVAFTFEGKSQTEVTMVAPFQATFFVPKAKPGTYTLRGHATAANPAAEAKSCESTVVVPERDKIDWFADGVFGKQRRQYEVDTPGASASAATITPGFCDPMLGAKVGPLFWFNDKRVSIAPAIGAAYQFGDWGAYDDTDRDYNHVSAVVEAVANYHFAVRGAYVGTGLGVWDLFDGDHMTPTWILNAGVPMATTSRGDQVFFVAEGRLFFDAPNGIDSNYQFWGGLRYVWK